MPFGFSTYTLLPGDLTKLRRAIIRDQYLPYAAAGLSANWGTNPLVFGDWPIGATAIDIQSAVIGMILATGDAFAIGSRKYVLTSPSTLDSGGSATIFFTPGLVLPVADGVPITLSAREEIAISRYNQGTKSNFISDDDLQSIADVVLNDAQEELDSAYAEKYNERKSQGDTNDTAMAIAETEQLNLLMNSIAIKVMEIQRADPTFRAIMDVGSGHGGKAMDALDDRIHELQSYTQSREADFAYIELWRK